MELGPVHETAKASKKLCTPGGGGGGVTEYNVTVAPAGSAPDGTVTLTAGEPGAPGPERIEAPDAPTLWLCTTTGSAPEVPWGGGAGLISVTPPPASPVLGGRGGGAKTVTAGAEPWEAVKSGSPE